jgi:RNA polymerase sigma factor (sigma-70 family)
MDIVIAEDHAIVRMGLVALLEGEPGWHVVAQVEALDGIRPAVEAHSPDVLVVDYAMPGGDTFATSTWLRRRYEDLRVVVLTGMQSPIVLGRLMDSALDGLLHKTGDVEELVDAIRAVTADRRYVSRDIAERVAEAAVDLSERELQTLGLIVQGLPRSEVASRLGISAETVKSHRKRLMAKLDVHTTAALVDKARELGLTTPDGSSSGL